MPTKRGTRGGKKKAASTRVAAPASPGLSSDASSAPSEGSAGADAALAGGSHAAQLEALKLSDPKFYEHLMKNDPQLLNFDESDASSDEDAESSDEEDAVPEFVSGDAPAPSAEVEAATSDSEPDSEGEASNVPLLTRADWRTVTQAAWGAGSSVRALQQVLQIYRVAVAQHTEADVDAPAAGPVRIGGAGMWSEVVEDTLAGARGALAVHLRGGVSATGPMPLNQLRAAPGWKKMRPLTQSLCSNTLALLSAPAPAATLATLLRGIAAYLPFFAAFPKQQRRLLKRLLALLGSTSAAGHGITDAGDAGASAGKKRARRADDDADHSVDSPAVMSVRAQAFLRLRQAATELPYPTIDAVLKGVYLAYVRASKFVNAGTLPRMTLLGNAVVEIAGLDPEVAYQHGFVYLRQLALHLRAALVSRDSKSTSAVLAWQWLACLRAWTAVLVAHGRAPDSPLWALTYPLCQLAMGVLPLCESPALAPMRLHVLKAVNDVAWACGTYCPIGPALVALLSSPAWGKRATGTGKPPVLMTALRLSTSELEAGATRDVVMTATLELLQDHMRAHNASPAFPELYAALAGPIRRWAKGCRNAAWRTRAQGVLAWAQPIAERTASARADAGIAPADMGAVAAWQQAEHAKAREARLALLAPQPVQATVQSAAELASQDGAADIDAAAKAAPSARRRRKRGGAAKGAAAVAAAAEAAPDAVQALDLGAF